MDEPRNHYAKLKKPVTKDDTVYDYFHMEFVQNRQLCRDRKQISGRLQLGNREWGVATHRQGFLFWGDEMF